MIKSHLKSSPKGFQTITPQQTEATPSDLLRLDYIQQGLRSVIAAPIYQEAYDLLMDVVWLDYPEDHSLMETPEMEHLEAEAWARFGNKII